MESIKKKIERRNKAWKAETKAQKCILVAKDILKQISTGKFKAKIGKWAEIKMPPKPEKFEGNFASTQEILLEGAKCECCALGSLTLSCITFNNKHEIFNPAWKGYESIYWDWDYNLQVNKIFSKKQLILMEMAFECGEGSFKTFWYDDDKQIKAAKMYKKLNPKQRLIAIMKNIIKNKGEFEVD